MSREDSEMSDVVVILVELEGMSQKEAVEKLKIAGLSVTDVDEEEGIVEGSIATARIAAMRELEFVDYVRNVFNYTSREGEDEEDEERADDAGA
jgi:hypothetical protein